MTTQSNQHFQQLVQLEYITPHICNVKLNDPAHQNALSEAMVLTLMSTLTTLAQDNNLKVIILSGNDDIFCSGADINMLTAIAKGKVLPVDINLPRFILDLPVPVIAAMSGHATGGGFALGLCADLILIARTSRYGFTFMNMGFTPGMGSTKLIETVLMPSLAHELLYTGQCKRGSEFEGKSQFNAILDKSDVMPYARDLAERIAEKPRESLVLLKRMLSMPKKQNYATAAAMESMMHEITFALPEIQQWIKDGYHE